MEIQQFLSQKAQDLKPSGIRKFFSIAAEMDDVIALGVGEPDFKTPWAIRKAGIDSLQRGQTFYTANSGLSQLQQEIANYLKRRFDMDYQKEQVGGTRPPLW